MTSPSAAAMCSTGDPDLAHPINVTAHVDIDIHVAGTDPHNAARRCATARSTCSAARACIVRIATESAATLLENARVDFMLMYRGLALCLPHACALLWMDADANGAVDSVAAAAAQDTSELSPATFLQLLHHDAGAYAAVIQCIRQHASHLLRQKQPAPEVDAASAGSAQQAESGATPDAVADSGDSQPNSHPLVGSDAEVVRQSLIDQVREQALVPGVITLVMSFLTPRDLMRLHVGTVSRSWLDGLKLPTAWVGVGWQQSQLPRLCADLACRTIYNNCSECDSSFLPLWFRSGVERLETHSNRLRSVKLLDVFRSFSSVSHLKLASSDSSNPNNDHDVRYPPSSVSAVDVSEALHALRLQSLELADPDPNLDRPLSEAIFGSADPDGELNPNIEPLMAHWANWLPELRCTIIHFDQPGRVLSSLHHYRWVALRSLTLDFKKREEISETMADTMLRSLSHKCMPNLQSLHVRDCYIGLTGEQHRVARSELTAAVLSVLPQLSGLTDLDCKLGLLEEETDGWLPGLHLLPALRVLRCRIDMGLESGSAFASSIALAPKLEVLHVRSVRTARAICRRMRMRCEAAGSATAASASSDSSRPSVPLRELKFEPAPHWRWWWQDNPDLPAEVLQDLALFPHLERLDACVLAANIPLLGSLRQLQSLRTIARGWADEDARTLGELPLAHLQSLELIDATRCVYEEQPIGGNLQAASFSPLTAGGLRHLLQLSSLTHIQLPWVAPDAIAYLRHLLAESGRAPESVLLERADPPPARILADRSAWARCSIQPAPAPLDFHQPDHHTCCCYSGPAACQG